MKPSQLFVLGDFTLRRESSRVIIGQSIDRAEGQARAHMYLLINRDGLRLTIRDAFWKDGERDVAVWDRHDAAQRFDRLRSGLRLQVTPHNSELYVELRQARLKDTEWSNLFAADRDSLNLGAGVDVVDALVTAGATAVGAREDILNDSGPARKRMGALFPVDAEDVPAVAYALTRIAPLHRGIRA